MEAARLYVGYAHSILTHGGEHAHEQLVGVGALLDNVVAGVAAGEAADLQLEEILSFRRGLHGGVEGDGGGGSTGAGDEYLAFIL